MSSASPNAIKFLSRRSKSFRVLSARSTIGSAISGSRNSIPIASLAFETPQQIRAALAELFRLVAARCIHREDARLLADICGLLMQLTPGETGGPDPGRPGAAASAPRRRSESCHTLRLVPQKLALEFEQERSRKRRRVA